ncbi:MAG: DNA alkylation repair protein [Myxococcota bacterium]
MIYDRPVVAIEDEVEALRAALAEVGTEERAQFERGYLKSDLEHIGVKVPEIRKLAKRFRREHPTLSRDDVWSLADHLWRAGIYELKSTAVFLLLEYRALLIVKDLNRVEQLVRTAFTWALIDHLAMGVVGDIVSRAPSAKRTLRRWAKDEDFWVRRTSLLALLGAWRRGTEFDTVLFETLAVPMLHERESFIRKALGWVLRDVSRKEPEFTYAFLLRHREAVSGLTMREGAKYLASSQRQALGLAK